MPTLRRTAPLLTAASLLVLVSGCGLAYRPYYDEGGSGASIDEFTYVSRPHSPKTVTLIDTRTGETLWTTDVPVGEQLVIRFYQDESPDTPYTPDMMRWGVFEAGERWGRKPNEMLVPPAHSRRVDLDVRPQPEFQERQPGESSPVFVPPPAQPIRPAPTPAEAEPMEPAPGEPQPMTPREPMPEPVEPPSSEPMELPPGVQEIPPSGEPSGG